MAALFVLLFSLLVHFSMWTGPEMYSPLIVDMGLLAFWAMLGIPVFYGLGWFLGKMFTWSH